MNNLKEVTDLGYKINTNQIDFLSQKGWLINWDKNGYLLDNDGIIHFNPTFTKKISDSLEIDISQIDTTDTGWDVVIREVNSINPNDWEDTMEVTLKSGTNLEWVESLESILLMTS